MVHCSDYRPSATLLRGSLRKRSREFVRENSLHVVPYFIDPSRTIYERSMWILIFNMAAIAAIMTIMTIWQKFQTSPTLTYLRIEREKSSVDFPNVYLCFDENHLNFSTLHLTPKQVDILKLLYRSKKEVLEYQNKDLGVVGYKRTFLEITPECGQFFSNCKFGKKSYACADLYDEKIATYDGVCCEFKSRPIDKDDLSWALQFRPSQYPISVHLSGKADGPPLYMYQPIYRMMGPASIQLSLTITTTASSVRFLSRAQRNCAYPEESPSHVDCEREHIKKALRAGCDCLPWFYTSSHLEECTLSQYQCLVGFAGKQPSTQNCYLSCDHTAYSCEKIERSPAVDQDESESESASEIRFHTWPAVRFHRVTRFGWLDLVVSFGGVGGFFLGFSIITLIELVYYFSLRTYCGAVLSVPKTRFNVVNVQPARKPPLEPKGRPGIADAGLKQRYVYFKN